MTVSGLSGVSAISAGGYHSMALLNDGTVMTWGDNGRGQLGIGSIVGPDRCEAKGLACSRVPVTVEHLSGVTAISGGLFYSTALLGNGDVMTWGYNADGQLGAGNHAEHAPFRSAP